jgi:hypothetical protein
MLVCESMDACISVCTVVKLSIHRSSRPIPSVEFSPTNSPKDEGKLFVNSNSLEQVYIVYTSVTKLSLAERLILLHLHSATDRNVIVVRGHRNIIVCKIADRPPPPVSCGEGMKDEDRTESCDPSPERELCLGWTGQTRALASLHLSISSSCTALATTIHNKKYLAP